MKKIIFGVLATLVSILIFGIFFQFIDIHSVLEVISTANIEILILSTMPFIISLFLQAKRWQIILAGTGNHLPYFRCFSVMMAAFPLSSFTPSKSGDIIRSCYLRNCVPVSDTIGSVISERFLDLCVLLLFSFIGVVANRKHEFGLILFISLLILIGGILFLCNLHRIPFKRFEFGRKISSVIKTLFSQKKVLSISAVLTIFIWLLAIIQTFLIFYSVNVFIPLLEMSANLPIAIFIGMIPVSLGGMGTRDVAILYLFSGFATPAQLLSVGILFSLFRYWLLAAAGLPFIKKATSYSTEESIL